MKNTIKFWTKYIGIVGISFFLLAMPEVVLASPYFSLNTTSDWNDALNDGRITPVTAYYDALEYHYGTLGTDFIQVTPDLMALTGAQSGYGDGLMMYWGDAGSDLPQVATWEYTYLEDPNLIGSILKLTITPPSGIQSVSLTINDATGGWISWDWNVGGPGGLTAGVPTTITIDPTIAAPQAGATSFAVAPVVGFNPALATSIQADELAVGANQWGLFPSVPVVGGTLPWNYWSALSVTSIPIPGAIWLLCSGMIGLVGIRRFKK